MSESKLELHADLEPAIIQHLRMIEDPRKQSLNFQHPLSSILFVTLVCSLCGSDDWETIVVQAGAMKDWLSQFVDLSNGIPSVRTFKRVFSALNPSELNKMLSSVAACISGAKDGQVVSFDGKAMRCTASQKQGIAAIHMLNAWSHECGICIGHTKVDDKSNEIPELPKLMEVLDLKGCIVTADAMHTQKATAAKAIELQADYVLPVKDNQPTLLEDVQLLFEEACSCDFKGFDGDYYETLEKGHGRVENRRYHSLDGAMLPSAELWPGLTSVGMIIRERIEKGKVSTEVRYYISSCEIDAKLLAKVVRGHWGIENSLHWVLDVTFREDRLHYRDRVGASNLGTIRKLSLIALASDKKLKVGKKGKRIAAATDPAYREHLLKLFP